MYSLRGNLPEVDVETTTSDAGKPQAKKKGRSSSSHVSLRRSRKPTAESTATAPSSKDKKDAESKKAPAMESTTSDDADTGGDTAVAVQPTSGALLALEADLVKEPDVTLPPAGNVSPAKYSTAEGTANPPATEEGMEVGNGEGTQTTPPPVQTQQPEAEKQDDDDDTQFIDASAATHIGKKSLRCQAKKDEKEEVQQQKQTDATVADEGSETESDPTKPEVFIRARLMFARMNGHPINCDSINELQKHAKSRIPKRNEQQPPESDEDDDDVMNSYEDWYTALSDPTHWTETCGDTNASAKQCFSQANKNKLEIAVGIWEPGQRCPFISCRVPQWNPDGVRSYRTRNRFLRHMCELHMPALYEWDCPVGICPLTFDRRCEAIQHARRNPKHHLAKKQCLDRYRKPNSKVKQRALKNIPFARTLRLNAEDYKPTIHVGELTLAPKRKEPDTGHGTSQPPEKKAKATTPVPTPPPEVNPWEKNADNFPALPTGDQSSPVVSCPQTTAVSSRSHSRLQSPSQRRRFMSRNCTYKIASAAYGSASQMQQANRKTTTQMYSGGACPKTTKASGHSLSTTTTASSTRTTTTPSSSTKSKEDKGVTDPKEVQKMIDAARSEIERSHSHNMAAIDKLMSPLYNYVEQKNLAAQLATKIQECDSLNKALQHQRNENMKLRSELAFFQEKEAVQAASEASLGASENIVTSASLRHSQALILQLAQSLAVPLPDTEGGVTLKPTTPMSQGSDWNLVSDSVTLQAATQQIEAAERPCRHDEREQRCLKIAAEQAERERQERIAELKREQQRREAERLEQIQQAKLQAEKEEKERREREEADAQLERELKALEKDDKEKRRKQQAVSSAVQSTSTGTRKPTSPSTTSVPTNVDPQQSEADADHQAAFDACIALGSEFGTTSPFSILGMVRSNKLTATTVHRNPPNPTLSSDEEGDEVDSQAEHFLLGDGSDEPMDDEDIPSAQIVESDSDIFLSDS